MRSHNPTSPDELAMTLSTQVADLRWRRRRPVTVERNGHSRSAPTRARCSRAIFSSPCAARISTATNLSTSRRSAARSARWWNAIGPAKLRPISRSSASTTRSSPINKSRRDYRRSLPLKVVAITGSNGKTSTKDFIAAVLGTRFRVTKTEGQFQQSRRSAADDAGGNVEAMRSPFGKSG